MRLMLAPGRALIIGNTDGIGLALTQRLLKGGWSVLGVSRRASSLESPRYRHAACDVSAADYPALLRSLLVADLPIDVCVYCAGIGELLEVPDFSREIQVFRVNLLGAVETAAVVLPAMIEAGRGHFLALSSLGDGISTLAPSYAASKSGVSAYFEGLALSLRKQGVRVTNVRFGFVATKMAKSRRKPFMMTTDRAVDVLLACLARRPARFSYRVAWPVWSGSWIA